MENGIAATKMEWKWNYDPCPKMGMDNFHFVPSPDRRGKDRRKDIIHRKVRKITQHFFFDI